MADSELKDLTDLPAPASTDIVYVLADPSGSMLDRKATIANVVGAADPKAHTHSYAATDIPYVTTAASAGLSAEVAIPGLAGSTDIAGVAGAGTTEEYDTVTTGLTWTPSTPNTVDSNTTRKSNLYIKSTDTTVRYGTKAWTPAGAAAFDARCKLSLGHLVGGTGAAGFLVGNADDSLRAMVYMNYNGVGGGSSLLANLYTWASAAWTKRSTLPAICVPGGPNYLRLSRDASNNITAWVSNDGWAWFLILTYAFTLTVTKLGFYSGEAGHEIFVDWLRTDV